MGFKKIFLVLFCSFCIVYSQKSAEDLSAFKNRYDEVYINDPQPESAGIYVRMSQNGINYLTGLASEALPYLLTGFVLPTIEVPSFKGEKFIVTKMEKPNIAAKFIDKTGVNLTIEIPYLEVEGDATIDAFFTAESYMSVMVKNWTINLDVQIQRELGDDRNNITVTRCHGNIPVALNFSGNGDDSDFLNSASEMIGGQIEEAIKEKICALPALLNSFFELQQQNVFNPIKTTVSSMTENETSVDPGFCSDYFGERNNTAEEEENEEEPNGFNELSTQIKEVGKWSPDLTLTYPLTFSDKDVIFGIDGGAVLNGKKADVQRSKISNVTLIRDQMLGFIVNEYVLNSVLYHIHENDLGYFEDSYSIRHLPKSLQPLARIGCSGCKITFKANITERPNIAIDRNGIVLILEGNLGAYFYRQNTSYELLTADGVFRVILKPQFRHSLVFSDIQLTGVDFKVYKADLKGMFSTTAKKLLNFFIPKTIWPKIQKSLRFAINRRGYQLPSICGVKFEKLHIGYVKHAAVITTDFNFNLPHFLQAFQKFMAKS